MENKELEMKKAPVVLSEDELEGVSGGLTVMLEKYNDVKTEWLYRCIPCGISIYSDEEDYREACPRCGATNWSRVDRKRTYY